MMRNFFILAVPVLLTGCVSSSEIQARYNDQQAQCRDEAVRLAAANSAQPGSAEANVGVRFSECMNKSGWRVSTPKPVQTAGGPVVVPPSGAPSANPSASVSSVTTAPEQATGGVSPSEGTATIYRGPHAPTATTSGVTTPSQPQQPAAPSVTPPTQMLSPSPSATPQAGAAPARYQPARPVATELPAYGRGAGRQF